MTPNEQGKHLWAGDWQEREGTPRAAAPPTPTATAPTEPPPPTGRRFSARATLAGFGAGAALAAGILVATGTTGGGSSHRTTSTSTTLPAAASAQVTPKGGQTRAGAIFNAASPAVVSIRTSTGSGTGFLIDGKGTIVTNAHVVESASTVTIHFGENTDAIQGTVVGTDPSSDLAVVHIDAAKVPSGTKPLKLADSDKVGVGETVVAIGNPFGLDRTLTEGIVSAVDRDIQAPNGFQIPQAIQTDAAINPGNSGGPLIDESGDVIGVNSQIETSGTSNGNVGVGFAVPSNTVRRIVPILQDGGTVAHAWLGVSMSDASGNGARVEQVVSGSPAESAGLQAGDVITGVDDKQATDGSELSQLIENHAPGDHITLHVQRNGSSVDVGVTLKTRPAQAPNG